MQRSSSGGDGCGKRRHAFRIRTRAIQRKAVFEQAIDEPGVEVAGNEIRMFQHAEEKRNIRFNSAHFVLLERATHPRQRFRAVHVPDHKLGKQRIVFNRHCPSLKDAAVIPNARPGGSP